jgi:hypothetical protein
MFPSRKPVALLCLMLALFAALIPLCGVFSILLVPLFLFFVALVAVPLRRDAESCIVQLFPSVSRLSSRAPPVA